MSLDPESVEPVIWSLRAIKVFGAARVFITAMIANLFIGRKGRSIIKASIEI